MLYRLRRKIGSPRPFSALYERTPETDVFEVPTADGLLLHLRRVRPTGSPAGGPPVILLHGLGSNHLGFHFPNRSLAAWLSERGHDVWLPELRGHGTSLAHAYDWCLDDYLDQDLPAIIDAVLDHSGSDRFHWLGHSMGGLLLMCYGAMHPNAPIDRAIAVASALDYTVGNSDFQLMLRARGVLEKLVALPFGTLVHLISPFLARSPIQVVERFNVWPSNIEPHMTRALYANCFHTIPISLLISLATTFDPEGLRTKTGICFEKEAAKFPFPLLLVAGNRDAQVSVDAIRHTANLVGDNARLVVHGPENDDGDHYGHWDLFIGRRAPEEVWPGIAEWLED